MVMEPYIILSYSIKDNNIGLLCHAIREITVILQASIAKKPKYARAMIRQLYIFNTKAFNPQLQKAYLANILVNPRGLPYTFYEINLLLKYQNKEFKYFQADTDSSLQETDEMFWLHVLSANALCKVRLGMNRIIVGHNRTSK